MAFRTAAQIYDQLLLAQFFSRIKRPEKINDRRSVFLQLSELSSDPSVRGYSPPCRAD